MPALKKNATVILKEYFGYLPGQKLMGFAEELKHLSTSEKIEIATLAAQELGCEVESPTAEPSPEPVAAV